MKEGGMRLSQKLLLFVLAAAAPALPLVAIVTTTNDRVSSMGSFHGTFTKPRKVGQGDRCGLRRAECGLPVALRR